MAFGFGGYIFTSREPAVVLCFAERESVQVWQREREREREREGERESNQRLEPKKTQSCFSAFTTATITSMLWKPSIGSVHSEVSLEKKDKKYLTLHFSFLKLDSWIVRYL